MKNPLKLYLSGVLVGRVYHDGDDQPFHLGAFVPNDAFSEFGPLFGELNRLSGVAASEQRRKEVRSAIRALTPKMTEEATGLTRHEPLVLIIEGHRIRWRVLSALPEK